MAAPDGLIAHFCTGIWLCGWENPGFPVDPPTCARASPVCIHGLTRLLTRPHEELRFAITDRKTRVPAETGSSLLFTGIWPYLWKTSESAETKNRENGALYAATDSLAH
jgi:hypothetical protein